MNSDGESRCHQPSDVISSIESKLKVEPSTDEDTKISLDLLKSHVDLKYGNFISIISDVCVSLEDNKYQSNLSIESHKAYLLPHQNLRCLITSFNNDEYLCELVTCLTNASLGNIRFSTLNQFDLIFNQVIKSHPCEGLTLVNFISSLQPLEQSDHYIITKDIIYSLLIEKGLRNTIIRSLDCKYFLSFLSTDVKREDDEESKSNRICTPCSKFLNSVLLNDKIKEENNRENSSNKFVEDNYSSANLTNDDYYDFELPPPPPSDPSEDDKIKYRVKSLKEQTDDSRYKKVDEGTTSWRKVRRGNSQFWICNGYQYVKETATNNRTFLKCRNYKKYKNREVVSVCKGRAVLDESRQILFTTSKHWCEKTPDIEIEIQDIQGKLKLLSETTSTPLETLYQQVMDDFSSLKHYREIRPSKLVPQMAKWRQMAISLQKISFPCDSCGFQTYDLASFRNHNEKDHGFPISDSHYWEHDYETKEDENEDEMVEYDDGEAGGLTCPYCSKSFIYKNALDNHVDYEHESSYNDNEDNCIKTEEPDDNYDDNADNDVEQVTKKKNRKRKQISNNSQDNYTPPSSLTVIKTSGNKGTRNWKPWMSGLGEGYKSGKYQYITESQDDEMIYAKCRYYKTFKDGSVCEGCPGQAYLDCKSQTFFITKSHNCDHLLKVKEERAEDEDEEQAVGDEDDRYEEESDSGGDSDEDLYDSDSEKPLKRKSNSSKSPGFSDWTYWDTGRTYSQGWMYNGYQYIRDSVSKNRIFVKCRYYKTMRDKELIGTCKGRGILNLSTNLFHPTKDHQCQGLSALKSKELEFRNKLKERSEKTTHNLQDVYNEVVSELNLNEDPMLEQLDTTSLIRQMFNWRRKAANKISHFCTVCFGEFDDLQTLNQHRMHDHNLPFKNESNTGVRKKRKVKLKEQILISGRVRSNCPFCSKQFSIFGRLTMHIRQVHTDINLDEVEGIDDIKKAISLEKLHCCDECGREVRDLSAHKMVAHGEMKECEHCNKSFNPAAYRRHMLTHRTKSFLCSQCGEGFINNQQLNQHFLTKHDPEYVAETYPCPQCDKTFTSTRYLNIHVNNLHTDVNTCNICGKKLCTKINLKLHMSIHTGEKQFGCEECKYRTARLDKFNDHRKKLHGLEKISRADYHAREAAKHPSTSENNFNINTATTNSTN